MKMRGLIIFAAYYLFQTTIYGQTWVQPDAKVTILVKDGKNLPVNNATVRIGFIDSSTRQLRMIDGQTSASGIFICEGCSDIKLNGDIQKDGYYSSGTGFVFTNSASGQWLPWNPTTTIILRRIGNPIALYAKKVDMDIPDIDKPCGFDLEAGDWVAPHGKGIKSDLIFKIHQEFRGAQDYDIEGELTFENTMDGLQPATESELGTNSIFKWDRLAPTNDYQSKFEIQNLWHGNKEIFRSFKFNDKVWEGYFLRVRTVEQNGKIVSTHYGKISGGIEVWPNNPNPKLVFTYYYNPAPNDSNLEWDTKKDLFGHLSFLQKPHMP